MWYNTLIKLVRYLNLKSAPIGLFITRRHRFPTNYLLQATHSLQYHIFFHLHDHIVCTRVPVVNITEILLMVKVYLYSVVNTSQSIQFSLKKITTYSRLKIPLALTKSCLIYTCNCKLVENISKAEHCYLFCEQWWFS